MFKEFTQMTLAVTFALCMGNFGNAMAASSMLVTDGLTAQMDNGNLRVEFKENGTVSAFIKNGVNLVKDIAAGKNTFYLDYNIQRKGYPLVPETLRVIENTEDIAHIAYVDTTSQLAVEYHFVMRKGDSGVYCYVVTKNNTKAEAKISELRTVYRMDRTIFDHAYNAERTGKLLRQDYMRQFKRLQDETYELPDGEKYTNGSVYSKYDYAGYLKDNPVWGAYGNGFGFWCIPVSTEAYSGGPMKQDLLVHYDAIVLNYLTSAHFGTGDFLAPANWQKMYGPWYLYVNTGDELTVIRDAKARATVEAKKWPYTWVKEEQYPLKRGTVSGRLVMTQARSAGGAEVILAGPGVDIQHEKAGYIFYTQADKDGKFTLKNVRPGNYELTAYMQSGAITQELKKTGIAVKPGRTVLGEVTWNPPVRQKIWQLGKSDRTAQEFQYGGELRNYKWQKMVPANLDYKMGKSKEKEDWYYAQTKDGEWKIHFNLPEVKMGKYHLMIAIASFSTGMGKNQDVYADVLLNGQFIKKLKYPNDQSVYRSATGSGTYHMEDIEVDAKTLLDGENSITLQNHGASIMYDTIVFEYE